MTLRVFMTAVLAALFTHTASARAPSHDIPLRVALSTASSDAFFIARGGLKITSAKSGAMLRTGEISEARIRPHRSGIRVNDLVFPVSHIRIEPVGGTSVSYEGAGYRGNFTVSARGQTLTVVNLVGLEDYLKGVLPSEVPVGWPMEALKAQAVAARTYALYKRAQNDGEDYDLLSDINDQVYGGMDRENENTTRAVLFTKGEILVHDKRLIKAYFHSTCGGRTENAVDVFGGETVPYLKSVHCNYDRRSPYHVWQYSTRLSELQADLSRSGLRVGKVVGISPRGRTRTGRVREVVVRSKTGNHTLKATDFRIMVGPKKVKSTRFKIKKRGSTVVFKGIGYGHGVGLCQWGAKGMAEKKFGYAKILKHYYPGVSITNISVLKTK